MTTAQAEVEIGETEMTTFDDMTPGGRDQALAWARSHDWGRDAHWYGGFGLQTALLVHLHPSENADEMAGGHCLPDLRPSPSIAGFHSLHTLRIWAGY